MHEPLLRSRRFAPLFATQFLGAFNDNVFKNALVILITFKAATCAESPMLVTVAAGLFILPFLLFSANAGQLADKLDKASLIRLVKALEIVIMLFAGVAFFFNSVIALLTVLFLMGTQSTLFGPIKYGILPEHLPEQRLMDANALIQGSTFIAILLGTVLGGTLMVLPQASTLATVVTIIALAVFGFASSLYIPAAPPAEPSLKIDFNPVRQTWRVAKLAAERRDLLVAIIGISWFWFVGAVFLQLLPGFTCDVLAGDAPVVTLLLTTFTVGIGLGAWAAARLTRGRIELGLTPLAALGMAVCAAVPALFPPPPAVGHTLGIAAVLTSAGNWPSLAAFLGLALFGGIYVVPQFAFVQANAPPGRRARIIASANILNALFMVLAALVTLALLGAGLGVAGVFAIVGALTAVVGALLLWASPSMATALTSRLKGRSAEPVD